MGLSVLKYIKRGPQAGRLCSFTSRHGEPAEDQEGHRHGVGARRGKGVPQRGQGPDQAGAEEEEGLHQVGDQAWGSSCPHILFRGAEGV